MRTSWCVRKAGPRCEASRPRRYSRARHWSRPNRPGEETAEAIWERGWSPPSWRPDRTHGARPSRQVWERSLRRRARTQPPTRWCRSSRLDGINFWTPWCTATPPRSSPHTSESRRKTTILNRATEPFGSGIHIDNRQTREREYQAISSLHRWFDLFRTGGVGFVAGPRRDILSREKPSEMASTGETNHLGIGHHDFPENWTERQKPTNGGRNLPPAPFEESWRSSARSSPGLTNAPAFASHIRVATARCLTSRRQSDVPLLQGPKP